MKKSNFILICLLALNIFPVFAFSAPPTDSEITKAIMSNLINSSSKANDWVEYAYSFELGSTETRKTTEDAWYYAVIKFHEPLAELSTESVGVYFVEYPEKTSEALSDKSISTEQITFKHMPLNICEEVYGEYFNGATDSTNNELGGTIGYKCVFRMKIAEQCKPEDPKDTNMLKECIEKSGSLDRGYKEVGVYFATDALTLPSADNATEEKNKVFLTKKMLVGKKPEIKFKVNRFSSANVEQKDGDNKDDKGNIGNSYEYDAEINFKENLKQRNIKDFMLSRAKFWRKENPAYEYDNLAASFKSKFKSSDYKNKYKDFEKVLKNTNYDTRRNLVEGAILPPNVKEVVANISSSGRVALKTEQTLETFNIKIGYAVNDYTYRLVDNELKAFKEEETKVRAGYTSTQNNNSVDAVLGVDYMYYKYLDIDSYGVNAAPLSAGFTMDFTNPISRENAATPENHLKVTLLVGGAIKFSDSVELSLNESVVYSSLNISPTKKDHWTNIFEVTLTKKVSEDISIFAKLLKGENGLTYDYSRDLLTGVDFSGYFKTLLDPEKNKK